MLSHIKIYHQVLGGGGMEASPLSKQRIYGSIPAGAQRPA